MRSTSARAYGDWNRGDAPASAGRLFRGVLLVCAIGVVVYGLALLRADPQAFRSWIREDGLAEWLTVIALGASALYAFATSVALGPTQPCGRRASAIWLLGACALAFGAMEEISWGQRVFGWDSPTWFVIHNDQHETNIHNLIVGGVKLNKLVFGKGVAVFVALYVLLFPVLYRRSDVVRRFANRSGLPIARAYQVAVWLVAVVAVRLSLPLDAKAAELLEFAGSVLFFLILSHPYNGGAFPRAAYRARRRTRRPPSGARAASAQSG